MSEMILGLDRIAFTLFGTIPVAWYGLIVTAAIVFAYILFLFLAKKRGIDMDFCLELFIWIVPIAVLFARLGYVLPKKEYFPIESFDDFIALFDITEGGITILAAIAGGIVAIFFCCLRTKKYHMARVCDCVVVALILGQIIGRWGNFFNQELFGSIITNPSMQWFPFAVFIDHTGSYHYALFFYESIINMVGLAIFLVMFFKLKDKIKPMGLTLLYIFWYGLVRSSLEYLKYDHQNFGDSNIGIAQTMCYIAMAISLVLFILLQTGKIHFTTKWFDGLIEKKKQQVADKQLAIETALKEQNASQNGDNKNANNAIEHNINASVSGAENTFTAINPSLEESGTKQSTTTDEILISNDVSRFGDDAETENLNKNVGNFETQNDISQNDGKKTFAQKTKEVFTIAVDKTKLFFSNIIKKSKDICIIISEKTKDICKKISQKCKSLCTKKEKTDSVNDDDNLPKDANNSVNNDDNLPKDATNNKEDK